MYIIVLSSRIYGRRRPKDEIFVLLLMNMGHFYYSGVRRLWLPRYYRHLCLHYRGITADTAVIPSSPLPCSSLHWWCQTCCRMDYNSFTKEPNCWLIGLFCILAVTYRKSLSKSTQFVWICWLILPCHKSTWSVLMILMELVSPSTVGSWLWNHCQSYRRW